MSTILALIYPSSNNQLETLSNPMHQVDMPERQTLSYMGNCSTGNDHIARPYTQSKKIQCLKQKMLLAKLQKAGIQLSKDQLAILADTGERIDFGPGAFTVTTNALFQADGVEVYDLDCDDLPNTQPSFMANISSSGSYVLSEGRQISVAAGTTRTYTPGVSRSNSGKQRTVICYNCPMVLEKKVNTTPIDYAALNQLCQDFEKRFVPQTKLSAKQTFWSQNSMNSSEPIPSCTPNKVEVPKELPKGSMVNTSLKKLKNHLAGFDMVVKERTTATTITEGMWGFEHTKACFRDEIIPFVKALKYIFNKFDQDLINELTEVQTVFNQMEQAVEQHRLESKTFEVKMNQVLYENDRLLEQVITKDIVNIVVNYFVDNASLNVHEFDTQTNQEIFQRDNSVSNQSAPNFDQYFELNELKAQSQEKDTAIRKLKERIKSLSGNVNEENVKKDIAEIESINIELEHSVAKLIYENKNLRNKREHLKSIFKDQFDSIKQTRVQSKEHSDFLIAEINAKSVENSDLNAQLQEKIQELLVYVSDTCPSYPLKSEKLVVVTPMNKARKVTFAKNSTTSDNNTQIQVDVHQTQTTNKPLVPSTNEKCSTNASRSKPRSETKNNKIMQPLRSNQKYQKIEAHTRNAKPSLTKEDSESKSVCLTCHKFYFDASHDLCVVQYLSEVNDRARAKAIKSIKVKE
ncbi:hypothetical protein Tco_0080440 [Tanacetum coccineum]